MYTVLYTRLRGRRHLSCLVPEEYVVFEACAVVSWN